MSKIARYFSKNKKLLLTTVAAGVIAMAFAFANTGTGQRFYVNGTQIENVKIYQSGNFTFIPGEDIAKAMGDDTEGSSEYRLIIKHDGKRYIFINGRNTYTVDGETKSLSIEEVNGVKIPSGNVNMKSFNNKLYVPMEILEKELGYDIKHDDYNVWVGEKPANLPQTKDHSVDPIPPMTNPDSNLNSNVTSNMKLSIDNGWVCPQLKSTATDNLLEDSKTLQRELEFIQNGKTPTSANYDPINGEAPFVTTSIGTPTPELEYCSIIFKGYTTKANDGYMQKINQINPQVLKFYFPSSWQWIHDKFMSGDGLVGQRYTIDGRDVYFTAGSISETIHFSKVGGTLGGSVNGSLPSSSGTIGVVTSTTNGQWEQSGGSWYFKKNDGTYAKGWLKDKGNWYYLDNNGTMKTGWIQDNGNWYFCWSNGQMASNTTISGYRLNESGAWVN